MSGVTHAPSARPSDRPSEDQPEDQPERPADRARRRLPTSLVAVLALGAVTAAWGSTFFMLKGVVTRVPAADFLAVRFAVAAVSLWVLRPGCVRRLGAVGRRRAAVLGLVYGVAQLLQTWGLEHTSASVSGFVTGTYVVITPLLAGRLLRTRVAPVVWVAVALATAGLAVLSLHGIAVGYGEALTLLSAGLYALHIVGLAAWSNGRDAYGLAVVQTIVVAGTCSIAALPGGIVLPGRAGDWAVLLYMALVAGVGALLLQTWAQAHLPPTRAAIVMTLEPVWAGGFAVTFGAEPVTARLVAGGTLALAAMLLAELGPRRPSNDPRSDQGPRARRGRAGRRRARAVGRRTGRSVVTITAAPARAAQCWHDPRDDGSAERDMCGAFRRNRAGLVTGRAAGWASSGVVRCPDLRPLGVW